MTTNTAFKRLNYKDLSMLYMMSGIDALETALVDRGNPVQDCEKIEQYLGSLGKDISEVTALAEKIDEQKGGGQRGRKPMGLNEQRTLKVQETQAPKGKRGRRYVVVPVDLFGLNKGQELVLSAHEDEDGDVFFQMRLPGQNTEDSEDE